MKVSLLLLTHDRYHMTKYVLERLLSKPGTDDFELLILDNGSADQRTKNLSNESSFPVVPSGSVELLETNIGIAAGFNKLLRKSKGEYICFLSNDILLGDNWLLDLLNFNQEIDKPGLTSIHCEGDKGRYTALLNKDDKFTYVWKPDSSITSGVSLVNRHVLETIGEFDERLGLYGREREQYAYRLHLLGFSNYYIPDQYSVHLGREVNDVSEYKRNKELALQKAGLIYKKRLEELKSSNYKIEL